MRFVLPLVLSLMLAACSHEAENTGAKNSSLMMPATYAMSVPIVKDSYMPEAAPRDVSRFERKVIVPGGMNGTMTPCAQNFDGIMDHLEGLMTPQIEENNRIAAMQAKVPGYRF